MEDSNDFIPAQIASILSSGTRAETRSSVCIFVLSDAVRVRVRTVMLLSRQFCLHKESKTQLPQIIHQFYACMRAWHSSSIPR
jgi:hypothetical protein